MTVLLRPDPKRAKKDTEVALTGVNPKWKKTAAAREKASLRVGKPSSVASATTTITRIRTGTPISCDREEDEGYPTVGEGGLALEPEGLEPLGVPNSKGSISPNKQRVCLCELILDGK